MCFDSIFKIAFWPTQQFLVAHVGPHDKIYDDNVSIHKDPIGAGQLKHIGHVASPWGRDVHVNHCKPLDPDTPWGALSVTMGSPALQLGQCSLGLPRRDEGQDVDELYLLGSPNENLSFFPSEQEFI